MPLASRSRRRLSWLSINIVLNIVAASVIAVYQDTLNGHRPRGVPADHLGHERLLGQPGGRRQHPRADPRPRAAHRTRSGVAKEVASASSTESSWARSSGRRMAVEGQRLPRACGRIGSRSQHGRRRVDRPVPFPLFLKRFKIDPALASGPVLTTLTDMCGFFLVLSPATLVLLWIP